MSEYSDEMYRELEGIFDAVPHIHTSDIPGIDLYMDQVTTFLQENLRGLSRDPDDDKFLTKTMINNYVKNRILFPPEKKKYNRDHIMLLIMIYYMKSFLSIGDIRTITGPVMDRCADLSFDRKKDAAERRRDQTGRRREHEKGKEQDKAGNSVKKQARAAGNEEKKPDLRVRDLYEAIAGNMEDELPRIRESMEKSIGLSSEKFTDAPEEDRPALQRFALICSLSAEVYMRKLFIEKILDAGTARD